MRCFTSSDSSPVFVGAVLVRVPLDIGLRSRLMLPSLRFLSINSRDSGQNLVNQVRKFCKLEAELADDKGKINYNKLTPEQALKLKKIKNKMEASQLEIEELLLEKKSSEKNNIKGEDIKKIRDDLFAKELEGDNKKWQRQGATILLAKLGFQ